MTLATTASSDRRRHGDEAEQADDADMETGGGLAAPPRDDQGPDLPGDDQDQERAASAPFTIMAVRTTSSVGAIGVRPMRMKKVPAATAIAVTTAI